MVLEKVSVKRRRDFISIRLNKNIYCVGCEEQHMSAHGLWKDLQNTCLKLFIVRLFRYI